jgi:hypothetical protein
VGRIELGIVAISHVQQRRRRQRSRDVCGVRESGQHRARNDADRRRSEGHDLAGGRNSGSAGCAGTTVSRAAKSSGATSTASDDACPTAAVTGTTESGTVAGSRAGAE